MTNINNMEEFNKNRLVLEFMCSLDLSPVYSIQTIDQLYDYLVTNEDVIETIILIQSEV